MNLLEATTGRMSRMSHVNRFSSFPVIRHENVAEHSWWVSFIAYLIAVDLLNQGYELVVGDVLAKALNHDVSEVASGDIIRSYKYSTPEVRDALRHADEINMQSLRDEIGGPAGGAVLHRWHVAKEEGLGGDIVAFADMAAAALYCRGEDASGNRALRAVVRHMYLNWFCKFHDHPQLGQYMDQLFPRRDWAALFLERKPWSDELEAGWDHRETFA